MDKKFFNQKGYGGLGMLLSGLVVAIVLFYFIFPGKFPKFWKQDKVDNFFCKPYIEDNGNIKPDAPTITAPSYEYNPNPEQLYPIIHQDSKSYRLVKANVPILQDVINNYFSVNDLHTQTPNTLKCPTQGFALGQYHHHFCQWVHEPIHVTSDLTKADKYAILYPATYAMSTAKVSMFWDLDGGSHELLFADYQILFLLHLHNDNTMYTVPGFWQDYVDKTKIVPKPWALVDVYQQVQDTNPSIPYKPLPEEVVKCGHAPREIQKQYGGDLPTIVDPSQTPSKDHKQLQLQWFVIQHFDAEFNWYFPACKPAINLYPSKDTLVNVKVNIPNGFLTYTDPLYPKETGWNVLAHPNGELNYLSNNLASSKGLVNYPTGIFPYLYYEGKIADQSISKPNTGFVKPYDQLPTFFDELLPKLGLNTKETTEFKQYWLKALPKSNYYYIGIIPPDQLEKNEPLTITPKQDTMIRVRLLFQQLDQPEVIQEPKFQTPIRNGFTVVDWGAYVKNDKSHPFTCVQ